MLRSLLHEQRESARTAMLEMLDSRRYEAFVSRFGRTLRARHLARSGPASRPARALAPDLIESRFRAVRKGGCPDRPRLAGNRLPPAEDPLQAPPLRARVPGRPLPGRDATADQTARDGPGRSRPAPGRGRRDRASPAPRHHVQRRPRPRDDLRHGRGRRALPAVDDRAASQFPAAYARLSGKQWKAFHKRLERERPEPPPPAVDAREEPGPEVE